MAVMAPVTPSVPATEVFPVEEATENLLVPEESLTVTPEDAALNCVTPDVFLRVRLPEPITEPPKRV